MKKRVVVTGLAVISPIGTGIETFWKALTSGVSGIKTITRFDTTDIKTKIAGEITDFEPTAYLDRKESRHMDRFAQYAVSAAGMAIKHSELNLDIEDKNRIGVMLGSGIGGMETLEAQSKILLEKGPGRVSPFLVPMMIANMGAGLVAINYGLKGPNATTVTACASSANAVGDAFRLLQWGYADVMIAGGSEAPITPLALSGFSAMKAMSTLNDNPQKACRPFDLARDGFVIGEGSSILILETLEHAQKRGAKIYGELIGYGSSCDAYHMAAPDPEGSGAVNSMKEALADAKIEPNAVNYINAHATSTPPGDRIETLAVKKVFKENAYKIAVSSTKSMTGHLLGAAGALEAMICILTIERGIIPPTINYETPDPECDLDFVPNIARNANVEIAMSNSFGFGGHNSTLIFKKYRNG